MMKFNPITGSLDFVQVGTVTQSALDAKADDADLTAHTSNTSNPHSVTKAQVGLGNVDNTADTDKPVSTATQTALDNKRTIISTPQSIYSVNGAGTQSREGYSVSKGSHTLVQRDSNGVVRFADPIAADQGATKGYVDSRTPIYGTGFPNGVVSAGVGSIYIDTAVTNGASSWIKKSGTGNTGWQVLEGDTGWRNISSLYTGPALTDGSLQIRRINNTVYLCLGNGQYGGIKFTNAITGVIGSYTTLVAKLNSVADGFSSNESGYADLYTSDTNLVARLYFASTYDTTVIRIVKLITPDIPALTLLRCGTIIKGTTQAWPTTLPGVSA